MNFRLKKFKIDISVSRIANLHYFEFLKKYHTFKDRHPFCELVYVDSGNINIESEGYSGILTDKQLIIHKSNELHSLSCTDTVAPNVIIIGFECVSERLNFFSENAYTLSGELIKLLTEIIKEGRSVFLPPYDIPSVKDMKKSTSFPFGADQLLKLKLETFLIELIRSTDAPVNTRKTLHSNTKIDEISAYIQAHYKEKITLDNLCFLFCTNKTTISKGFVQAYGETVIRYLNRLRIKQSKKLMREQAMTITQVAAEVGFSSVHYFSKCFKLYEKKSPLAYLDTIKSNLGEDEASHFDI